MELVYIKLDIMKNQMWDSQTNGCGNFWNRLEFFNPQPSTLQVEEGLSMRGTTGNGKTQASDCKQVGRTEK